MSPERPWLQLRSVGKTTCPQKLINLVTPSYVPIFEVVLAVELLLQAISTVQQ